ncbi:hypothetical protein [Mariniblastus fucicola]|uniref:Uncharacterized protein n=1 Tax=Mariniblastus fucicola TaxID=980251 RepID=A0A5B9P6Q4_9BACT|nr:hypothetical protein [Mariniblastus fucicola]QEG21938.1 hypothetical protein MFFC18_17990 [Mariniblastus fucicola]
MAKQFNPFHHWLGFSENVYHPNHFQLFGVKPNMGDPIGFGKQVHSRAKAMLKQLEQMSDEEIGDRRKLHTKLRRLIVRAHEVLLDDKLRASYVKGLREKARDENGVSEPLDYPSPYRMRSVQNDDPSASQTSKHPSLTMKLSSMQTIKQRSDVELPDPASSKSTVPMAIPLAKPVPGDVREYPNRNADSGPATDQIVVRPRRTKRTGSWLIPIFFIVMTVLGIAGLAALLSNFGNRFELRPFPKMNTPIDQTVNDPTPQNIVPPNERDDDDAERDTDDAERDTDDDDDVGANSEASHSPSGSLRTQWIEQKELS